MATDLFSQQADLYARFRPQYPKEIYEFLLSHLGARDMASLVFNGAAVAPMPVFHCVDDLIEDTVRERNRFTRRSHA